ncbi:hypothetical protein ACP70R_009071 [Stipagrostis hirtigluma subsp. patula]
MDGSISYEAAAAMETLTDPTTEPSDSPAAAAAADPRWVMLNCRGYRWLDSFVADARTVAESLTSTGLAVHVSLGLAPPPASSFLYYDLEAGAAADGNPVVIAAHTDAVLFQMTPPKAPRRKRQRRDVPAPTSTTATFDYFVYEAGAGQPPSLSLLPTCDIPKQYERGTALRKPKGRMLQKEDTGVLRRGDGDGELLVAQLEVTHDEPWDTAELCVLRPARREWELKTAVPIIHGDDDAGGGEPRRWRTADAVVSVGDRFLCWVNLAGGFLLCDMAGDEARPKLRRVALPVGPPNESGHYYTVIGHRPCLRQSRNMGAAGSGAAAVRFVSIDSRCCCGGPGTSTCERSRFAFTVTTWTMTLSTDEPMTWVKDSVLDCEELWGLPGYEGLPRVPPQYPIVSSDNPDIVCFMICEGYSDPKTWMIEVDTRSKTLMSIVGCTTNPWEVDSHLPVKLRW